MTMNSTSCHPSRPPSSTRRISDVSHGAFGTIAKDRSRRRAAVGEANSGALLAILGPGLIVMVGDNDAGAFGTYTPGRPELRHDAAVDAARCCPGALRQPGDGAAPGRGDRRRPRAADLRALRQVLGRVQRHRPVPAQRADHRHRVHRHHARRSTTSGLPKIWASSSRRCAIMAAASTGNFRRFERFSMVLVFGSLLLVPIFFMVHPPLGAGRARSRRSAAARRRQAQRRDAADHRHRRHHGRAVAAVLPAELRHRQAHHAALHRIRARSTCGSASCSSSSAPSR